ncbi:MAG: hypothetical protein WC728_12410 [Elusimicrobiota bacterium]
MALVPAFLLLSSAAQAGWIDSGHDRVTSEDFKRLSKISGNHKKNWRNIQRLMDETRANEARLQEIQRQRRRAGQNSFSRKSEEKPGAAVTELSGAAGQTFAAAPSVGEAAPVGAKKKGKMSAEESELWKNIQAYVQKKVLTPEIRDWMAGYLWSAARHSGGSEVLRDHVNHIRQGLASKGEGLPTVKLGPMPDADTYGLYTTGVREIELRAGMPKDMFIAVADHEFLHATDDTKDQRDKGGTPISKNWHRDNNDNIFAGKDGQSSSPTGAEGQDSSGTARPDAQPKQDKAQTDKQKSDQFDAEYAETLAWRGMSCVAGVPAIIPEVQRCK